MKRELQKGFTLIEMLVVAPIVILAIGAFLTVIISMTGEVISSRASNALVYNIQDALNRVEQDTRLSTGFLAQTDTNPAGAGGNALQPGQGLNNTTTPFLSVSGGGSSLILNMIATNDNPLSPNSSFVFLRNQPDPCASPQANLPLSYNVVYFVQDSTLWRRVVMPQNFADTTNFSCATPWQRPSCNPAFIANPGNAFCATEDIRLVDGVTAFTTQYLNGASGEIVVAAAMLEGGNDAPAIAARNIALQTATTLSVGISSTQTAAGREVSQASSLRVSRLDTNASAIATLPASTIPSAPTVGGTTAPGARAVFTWPSVDGATGYTFQFNINGGATQTGFTNANNRTFTVSAPANEDVVNAQVFAINSAGTSVQSLRTVTIPLWEPLVLANTWSNYEGSYARAAYTKTRSGVVLLKGLIQKSSAAVSSEIIATLPEGYRPDGGTLLFGTGTHPNVTGRADVWANGQVRLIDGNAAWFSLDAIRFVAAGSGYPRTLPLLANGWTNFPGFAPISYLTDSSGRVFTQGLGQGGSFADGIRIYDTPPSLYAPQYMHVATRSSAFGYVGIDSRNPSASSTLHAKGVGSSFLSMNTNYYPVGTTGWASLPLVNSWAWYGTFFSTPQYRKSSVDNVVTIKGLIANGSGTIATLPAGAGFRPKERLLFTTVAVGNYARIDITADGQIIFLAGAGTYWVSLDGISFVGEQ